MNCAGVIREISNYIDGDLDAATKLQIAGHLHDCVECRLIVIQTKLTVEIFLACEPVDVPEDVRLRLHEALRRKLGGSSL